MDINYDEQWWMTMDDIGRQFQRIMTMMNGDGCQLQWTVMDVDLDERRFRWTSTMMNDDGRQLQ